MDDDVTTPGPRDDTTGHVLHGESAENPQTGGRAPSARVVDEQDDTEGHVRMLMATGEQDDDTERGPGAHAF